VTCVRGETDENDKLKQLMVACKKVYEYATVYLREITAMRIFALQLVCICILLLFVIFLNFKSFLNKRVKENAKFLEVVTIKNI
jgi:hypothetical protein